MVRLQPVAHTACWRFNHTLNNKQNNPNKPGRKAIPAIHQCSCRFLAHSCTFPASSWPRKWLDRTECQSTPHCNCMCSEQNHRHRSHSLRDMWLQESELRKQRKLKHQAHLCCSPIQCIHHSNHIRQALCMMLASDCKWMSMSAPCTMLHASCP